MTSPDDMEALAWALSELQQVVVHLGAARDLPAHLKGRRHNRLVNRILRDLGAVRVDLADRFGALALEAEEALRAAEEAAE